MLSLSKHPLMLSLAEAPLMLSLAEAPLMLSLAEAPNGQNFTAQALRLVCVGVLLFLLR